MMSSHTSPPTFRGHSFGITVLTVAQLLIGAIHIFSGLLLFVFEDFSVLPVTAVYDVYTFVYGLLVAVFAVFFWRSRLTGWVGTVGVSLFVIIADSLRLLDLPTIPGIPKAPAFAEIGYSVVVVGYLLKRRNIIKVPPTTR
jgi:hypothetical protein